MGENRTNFFTFINNLVADDYAHKIIVSSTAFAGSLLVLHKFIQFPYGKTYIKRRFKFQKEVNDRLSFIIVHGSAPFVFYLIFKSLSKPFISFPTFFYMLYYFHLVVVYPWFRSIKSRPWPLRSIIYYTIRSMISGYNASIIFISKKKEMNLIFKLMLFVALLNVSIVTSIHDYILCYLRQPGEMGYRIPMSLLFNVTSSPNYLFELLMWSLFSLYFKPSLDVFAFWFLHASNLITRALDVHEAYRKLFSSKYPPNRAFLLPKTISF